MNVPVIIASVLAIAMILITLIIFTKMCLKDRKFNKSIKINKHGFEFNITKD